MSIDGSRHDLSYGGGGTFGFDTGQICVFCHTPHGANTSVREKTLVKANPPVGSYMNTGAAGGPPLLLWNRALSNAPSESVGFEVYQSSTLNANNSHIRVYSLLCLSCHDGVGAMNVLTNFPADGTDNPPGSGILNALGGNNQIGDQPFTTELNPNIGNRMTPDWSGYSGDNAVQLQNDHPISFDYSPTLISADGGLKSKASAESAGIRFFTNPSGTANISVECSSCHDPHDQGAGTSDPQFPFLIMSNANSAICVACHNK